MPVIVRSLVARIIDHPVRQDGAIISSLGRHNASRYVTVAIYGEDGLVGYGEAATAPPWGGETAESAKHLIDHLLAPKIVGSRFDHPAEALVVLDRELY